jgi:hypothetical protein
MCCRYKTVLAACDHLALGLATVELHCELKVHLGHQPKDWPFSAGWTQAVHDPRVWCMQKQTYISRQCQSSMQLPLACGCLPPSKMLCNTMCLLSGLSVL